MIVLGSTAGGVARGPGIALVASCPECICYRLGTVIRSHKTFLVKHTLLPVITVEAQLLFSRLCTMLTYHVRASFVAL